MIKDISSHEVDARLRLLWFGAFSLLIKFQRNSVTVYFCLEVIGYLEGKHQFVAVFYGLNGALGCLTSLNPDNLVTSKWIELSSLSKVDLSILVCRFSKHELLLSVVLLITDEGLLASLAPHSDALVSRDSHKVVTNA